MLWLAHCHDASDVTCGGGGAARGSAAHPRRGRCELL